MQLRRQAAVALGMGVCFACAQTVSAAIDTGFSATPGRNLADSGSSPRNKSIDLQGGNAGDIRTSSFGNTAWNVYYGPSGPPARSVDEEIANAAGVAKTGSQSFHVSNYFDSGLVNHIDSPWLDQPAGETGSKDMGGAGVAATSNTFHLSFWFKSAATSDPNPSVNGTGTFGPNFSFVSISPDDGNSSRWGGRIDISDKTTTNGLSSDGGGVAGAGVQVGWESDNNGPGGGGNAFSPALAYDTWYRVELNETFVDGVNAVSGSNGTSNDIVVLQVFDESNVLQWQADGTTVFNRFGSTTLTQTGITDWETAGFSGVRAVNSVSMRMRVDPDTGLSNTSDQFQSSVPAGFYFDDFTFNTGAGRSYSTSFEPAAIPEPASFALLAAGGLFFLRRRRRL